MHCKFLSLVLPLVSLVLSASGTPIYLATDQTGQQSQIDVNHTSSWTLVPGITFDLSGGLFVMKAGNSASDTTTLAVYQGSSSAGTLIASVVLSNSTFCLQAGCGSFALHQFFFSAPVTLTSDTTYFVSLTSAAPDVQSQAYFIKSDSFFASDINGTPIVPSPLNSSSPSGVPEPSSFLLSGAGLLVLGLAIRRREHLGWKVNGSGHGAPIAR